MNHFVKALVLAALAALLVPSPCQAQPAYWRHVSGPHTGSVPCGIVKSNGIILLGAVRNSPVEFNYYRSTDNGSTWEGKSVDPAEPYAHEPRAFLARPNGEIYLLTDRIYRSTDDGATWEFKNNANGQQLYFPSNGNMYIGSPYGIYESTDGGGSWNQVGPQYTTGIFAGTFAAVRQFAATADGHFVAVTDGNVLWRSQNGQGWTRLKMRLNTGSLAVVATDEQHTFYVAHRNRIYVSSDNGGKFRAAKAVAVRKGEFLTSLSVHPNGELYAGTNMGRAYRLYSTGKTFRVELIVNAASAIISFAFNAATQTTAIGTEANGVFIKQSPSQPFVQAGFNISEVWSFARTTGPNLFALSQYSRFGIYRSTDEGRSWNPLSTQFMGWVDLIGGTSTGYLFAMHCCGFPIRRSGDNGATWVNITDPGIIDNSFNSFLEAANGNILLGSSGGIFRSADNGSSWTNTYLGSAGSIHQAPNGILYAASNGIIRSTDNGSTWTAANDGLTNTSIRSIASNSIGTIFLSTGAGVFQSTNQGGLWRLTSDALTRGDLTQIVADATDRLFVGTGSTIGWYNSSPAGVYSSQDDGASWTQLVSGLSNQNIISLMPTKDGYLLAASERGGLFTNAPPTLAENRFGRAEEPEQAPAEFGLDQNYPNPFNPLTTIDFTLAEEALVTLRVYNTLGQEIAVLAEDEEFSFGTFQLDFDASTLPSGVYYYRLAARGVGTGAEQFASIKKMLLMK